MIESPVRSCQRVLRSGLLALFFASLVACGGGGGSSGSGEETAARGADAKTASTNYYFSIWVTGAGTVTSSPAGISCTGTKQCVGYFKIGSSVTLSAQPIGGTTISGWGGSCSGTGASCKVTMNDPRDVSISFAEGTESAGTTQSIRVSGNHLIDAHGNTVQLRGVNVSGLESVAIQGWSPGNPWGGQTGDATPNWATIKTWGVNAVRLPLNEASWLSLSCVDVAGIGSVVTNGVSKADAPGTTIKADPGGNYRAAVSAAVAGASAAGLYVILDLHWTAPASACPMAQNPMADADHSVAFWSSIASEFRGYPNVAFELFNEPYMYWLAPSTSDWAALLNGATETEYVTGGTPYEMALNWQISGMQQMVDAVRATGATNVILSSGANWAQDLSGWLDNMPVDTLHQLAAVWHAYPTYGTTFGTAAYVQPNYSPQIWADVKAIVAAGYPVVITEFGDQDSAGTTTSPFASNLLPWADLNGVSYLGWAWDVWQNANNVLITNAAGNPTPGFGTYVKAHYLCRASGEASCP
jgi:aryl-phospho-beta-D-glucosidase BglC (GH1 family)